MIKKNILLRNHFAYVLSGNRLLISRKGKTFLSLNLQPMIDGKTIRFTEIREEGTCFILYSDDHSYEAVIDMKDGNIAYWIENGPDRMDQIIYFSKSFGSLVHMRTFSTDTDYYVNMNDNVSVEIKSKVIPQNEQENFKLKTWFLSPQQRAFSVKLKYLTEQEHPWFGFSLPGRLPVNITKFHLTKLNGCEIEFIDYRASNNHHRLPKVYLFDHLSNGEKILDHHYLATKIEKECIPVKEFYHWWSRPVLTPSSDFLDAWSDQTFDYKTVLTHIEYIEEKTGVADFNVIIDGYWFQKVGLYKETNKKIFKENHILKSFIDQLHKKNHKVILWWSQFRNDHYEMKDIYKVNENALFDYTKGEDRRKIEEILHYMLSDETECLNADGIKLDYGFLLSNHLPYEYSDPGWGTGDQYRSRVNEFIYQYARSLKSDVYISDITAEPSASLGIIRLNDDWGESVHNWAERGRKASTVKHAMIDTDGYLMFQDKFWRYSMLAPIIGVPNFYCVKHFFGGEPIGEDDYKLLSSCWNVYLNAPVTPDMEFHIDPEANEYWRKYTNGALAGFYSALCVNGNSLVTYSFSKIMVTSIKDTVIKIPLFSHKKVIKVKGKRWNNTYEKYEYLELGDDYIILKLDNIPVLYQWIEIIYDSFYELQPKDKGDCR